MTTVTGVRARARDIRFSHLYVCAGASLEGRLLEYSAAIRGDSLDELEYPGGAAWRS